MGNNSNSNNNFISNSIINEIPYTPPQSITTSYPVPSLTLKQSYYNSSINNNIDDILNSIPSIPQTDLSNYGYTDTTFNSLNAQEFVENQERIDELVRKTEKSESRNKYIFQSNYPVYNNYSISNSRPVLHHSSSVYKTQSPFFYSTKNSNNNSINYQFSINKPPKYSIPITKYSIQPIKYSKPKIIYSSMTAKRNFEGNFERRQLNSLYNKYGMSFK